MDNQVLDEAQLFIGLSALVVLILFNESYGHPKEYIHLLVELLR